MITKIDSSILEELAGYDSATVQNAAILVRGYVPAEEDYTGPELQQLIGGSQPVTVGYALTSVWTPITEATEPVADNIAFFDSIADAGVPIIVVLKDGDSVPKRGAIIGDGMAVTMRVLGAIGAVVDGNARDIAGIRQAGMALWATGKVPGHGPFALLSYGDPVEVAQMTIETGDILVCDQDGTTRVPVEIANEVAKACARVRNKESTYSAVFKAADFSVAKWRATR